MPYLRAIAPTEGRIRPVEGVGEAVVEWRQGTLSRQTPGSPREGRTRRRTPERPSTWRDRVVNFRQLQQAEINLAWVCR